MNIDIYICTLKNFFFHYSVYVIVITIIFFFLKKSWNCTRNWSSITERKINKNGLTWIIKIFGLINENKIRWIT